MFKRPKEMVFDVSEIILLSTEISDCGVTQKSQKTPTYRVTPLFQSIDENKNSAN